jgi:5'-nucleotidase
MIKKPLVLLTNDDGIQAPGIESLWRSVKNHANTMIVAPDSEQSGMGLATSPNTLLHLKDVSREGYPNAWCVNGTPADCVKLGLSVVLKDKKPDLILSGINRGSNAGRCIFYSGTVGCVIEGALRGILGIAFSAESYASPIYEYFEPYIFPIISLIIKHPPPLGTFFNVTFPSTTQVRGIRLARQGQSYWEGRPSKSHHPEGHLCYSLTDNWNFLPKENEESDIELLKEGFITIVPIHIREWTDVAYFQSQKEIFNTFPSTECLKSENLKD